jgi:hypothetical protein
MLKKYSFLFSFLIMLSSTLFLSMSVIKILNAHTDIENLVNEDSSEDSECDFEKEEKSLLSSLCFQYNLLVSEIQKSYSITNMIFIDNCYSTIDSPPPDLV